MNLKILVNTFSHPPQVALRVSPALQGTLFVLTHTLAENAFCTVIQVGNEDIPQIPGDLLLFVTGCQLGFVPDTQTIQFSVHVAVHSPSWQVTNW